MKKIFSIILFILILIFMSSCNRIPSEGYKKNSFTKEEIIEYLEIFLGNTYFNLSENSTLYIDQYSRKYYTWVVYTDDLTFEISSHETFVYDGFAGEFGHIYYEIENNYSQCALKKILSEEIYDGNCIIIERDYFLTFNENGYAHIKIKSLIELNEYYSIAEKLSNQIKLSFPFANIYFIFELPSTGLKNTTIGYINDFNEIEYQKLLTKFNENL